jgi:hypothetical protein
MRDATSSIVLFEVTTVFSIVEAHTLAERLVAWLGFPIAFIGVILLPVAIGLSRASDDVILFKR